MSTAKKHEECLYILWNNGDECPKCGYIMAGLEEDSDEV